MFERKQRMFTRPNSNDNDKGSMPFVLQRKGNNNFRRNEQGKIIGSLPVKGGFQGEGRYFAYDGEFLGQIGSGNTIMVMDKNMVNADVKEHILTINNSTPKRGGISNEGLFLLYEEIIPNSKELHRSPNEAVLRTIYNKNIQSTDVDNIRMEFMNDRSLPGHPAAKGKGGHTSQKNEEITITLNSNAQEAGHHLNSSYFMLINIMYHESLHVIEFKEGTTSNAWLHFDIMRKQMKHWSYARLNGIEKNYVIGLGTGYLSGQQELLENNLKIYNYDTSNPEFVRSVNVFRDNIDFYSQINSNMLYDESEGVYTNPKTGELFYDMKKWEWYANIKKSKN